MDSHGNRAWTRDGHKGGRSCGAGGGGQRGSVSGHRRRKNMSIVPASETIFTELRHTLIWDHSCFIVHSLVRCRPLQPRSGTGPRFCPQTWPLLAVGHVVDRGLGRVSFSASSQQERHAWPTLTSIIQSRQVGLGWWTRRVVLIAIDAHPVTPTVLEWPSLLATSPAGVTMGWWLCVATVVHWPPPLPGTPRQGSSDTDSTWWRWSLEYPLVGQFHHPRVCPPYGSRTRTVLTHYLGGHLRCKTTMRGRHDEAVLGLGERRRGTSFGHVVREK